MTHYSDDELAWHLLEPRGDVAAHLQERAACSARNADLQWLDAALSTAAAWTHPRNIGSIEDPTREHLREIATRLSRETADAKRSLGPLIANPLPFIWKDVSRKRGFRTAGGGLCVCCGARQRGEEDALPD